MAEKKSFVLYLEYGEYFAELTDEQAGKVIKAIYAFEQGQELPEMTALPKLPFPPSETSWCGTMSVGKSR